MNQEMLNVLTVIGKLQKQIARVSSMREAIEEGLKTIRSSFPAEEMILWYADGEKGGPLRPYYWLGDRDFTAAHYDRASGMVGQAYTQQEAVRCLEYVAGSDPVTEEIFGGMAIRSMLCVPFADTHETLGCIQIIRTQECFTEEIADLIEIFAGMIAMAIEENELIPPQWHFDDIILRARDITKSFQNGETVTSVLKGINLDIYRGEFVVVLGESGCGKSTFLNIIGGLETADGGSFSYCGRELAKAGQEELTAYRRDHIGFVFQSYNLMPNLTAKQNLDLIGELVREPMDSMEALRLVGLENKSDNYPSQLSGGQQQRVSIARALIKRPELIFADEPTAALDYATSIEVLSVLEKVIRNGTTLVMVTHNEEITKMADRVVRFRNGKTYETTINRHRKPANELVW